MVIEDYLTLADWRRRVAELYAQARQPDIPAEQRWLAWRQGRDRLFAEHPQSPLAQSQKANFIGLEYFPYEPALRFRLPVQPVDEWEPIGVQLEEDGLFQMRPCGRVEFKLDGRDLQLTLFWVMGYGGGLFLPFRDTSGQGGETYGGGRYLLDTIKHADLGAEGGELVLDFNFAYNPSCAYNPRWHCPLAPQENWLPMPLRAGEKRFGG